MNGQTQMMSKRGEGMDIRAAVPDGLAVKIRRVDHYQKLHPCPYDSTEMVAARLLSKITAKQTDGE